MSGGVFRAVFLRQKQNTIYGIDKNNHRLEAGGFGLAAKAA